MSISFPYFLWNNFPGSVFLLVWRSWYLRSCSFALPKLLWQLPRLVYWSTPLLLIITSFSAIDLLLFLIFSITRIFLSLSFSYHTFVWCFAETLCHHWKLKFITEWSILIFSFNFSILQKMSFHRFCVSSLLSIYWLFFNFFDIVRFNCFTLTFILVSLFYSFLV